MNSINLPCSRCVASQLSWQSITPVFAEVTGLNPIEALVFSGFFFLIAQIGKFTAIIIPHFHLPLQFKYEFMYTSQKCLCSLFCYTQDITFRVQAMFRVCKMTLSASGQNLSSLNPEQFPHNLIYLNGPPSQDIYENVILPNVIPWELLLEFPGGEHTWWSSLLVSLLCSPSTGNSFLLPELSSSHIHYVLPHLLTDCEDWNIPNEYASASSDLQMGLEMAGEYHGGTVSEAEAL